MIIAGFSVEKITDEGKGRITTRAYSSDFTVRVIESKPSQEKISVSSVCDEEKPKLP
jgi:hypothetical protein